MTNAIEPSSRNSDHARLVLRAGHSSGGLPLELWEAMLRVVESRAKCHEGTAAQVSRAEDRTELKLCHNSRTGGAVAILRGTREPAQSQIRVSIRVRLPLWVAAFGAAWLTGSALMFGAMVMLDGRGEASTMPPWYVLLAVMLGFIGFGIVLLRVLRAWGMEHLQAVVDDVLSHAASTVASTRETV